MKINDENKTKLKNKEFKLIALEDNPTPCQQNNTNTNEAGSPKYTIYCRLKLGQKGVLNKYKTCFHDGLPIFTLTCCTMVLTGS